MISLIQAARKATVAQITTLYQYDEQKGITEHKTP